MIPAAFEPITGSPQAIASIPTKPKLSSNSDGNTNASQVENMEGSSSWVRTPKNATLSAIPKFSASIFSFFSSSPEPTKSNLSDTVGSSPEIALNSVSTPFPLSKRPKYPKRYFKPSFISNGRNKSVSIPPEG